MTVFYCNGCDAERDTCEPTFCRDCGEATEGYALREEEPWERDVASLATIDRWRRANEFALRRVDTLRIRRVAGAAAVAAALAVAAPAAASEPLLPVATDDAVIATADATLRDIPSVELAPMPVVDIAPLPSVDVAEDHTFRMPPERDGPVDYDAERNLRDKLRSLSPMRPDLSRDRWLMCGAFAFDAATTIWSVESGNHEAAPVTRAVIGKRPSPLAVAGFMAAKCGAFLALGTVLERTDTRGAKLFYRINIGVATVAGVNNVGVALKVGF